jgi:hypothetical protein
MKNWFSVSDDEQQRRFQQPIKNNTKRWKLSPLRKRLCDFPGSDMISRRGFGPTRSSATGAGAPPP